MHEIKAIAGNWCLPGHPLASVWVYKKFVWVLSGFIEMLLKNPFKNLKKMKKLIIICGIRSTLLHYKKKLMSSQGGPRVVVITAAFHARVRGSVPGVGGLKVTKMFLPHPRVKLSIVGSLRDREVPCSASDRQGSNFESCVWKTVSSHSSHHPQKVLLAQFSLYVHKGDLKPDSFSFCHSKEPL